MHALTTTKDIVYAIADDLSFGPFADDHNRTTWMYDFAPSDRALGHNVLLSETILRETERGAVVWMSNKSVSELCGLYKLICYSPVPIQYVDVSSTTGNIEHDMTFGHFSDQEIISYHLLGRQLTVDAPLREEAQQCLSRFDYSSVLRRIEGDRVVDAGIDYYDNAIFARLSSKWESVGSIVADVAYLVNGGGVMQIGPKFLTHRSFHHVSEGRIEMKCDDSGIFFRNV